MSDCRIDTCREEATETVLVRYRLYEGGPELEDDLGFCAGHAPAVRGEVSAEGLSITHYAVQCSTCGSMRPMKTVPAADGSGGSYVCAECGTSFGGWINGGTLDLGLVDDSQLNPDNRFEVFKEGMFGPVSSLGIEKLK